MDKIKCGTFGNLPIPKEILKKIEADRVEAESKHETKAENLPIQCVSNSACIGCDNPLNKNRNTCYRCGNWLF